MFGDQISDQQALELKKQELESGRADREAQAVARAAKETRTPREIGGKRVVEVTDASGRVLRYEPVGEAYTGDQIPKTIVVRMPDDGTGVPKYQQVPQGQIPPGAVPVGESPTVATPSQDVQLGEKLADLENFLLSGVDSKGKSLENMEALQGYADTYNKQSKTHDIVRYPEKPGGWFGAGAKPSRYVKVRKGVKIPAVGDVISGMEYLGGNPNDESNWKEVK